VILAVGEHSREDTKVARVHIDHVAMCVWDLDKAIADWTDILNVLSPGHTMQVTRGEGADVVDETPMIWATFQNPDPYGVSIQLWSAGAEDTWVQKVLAKRGEFVHHIAMLSDNFGHTIQECKDAGLPLVYDTHSNPDTMPWLLWNFIPEDKAHGTLIELATRYHAVGDRWYPHPGNAENGELVQELNERYY
jgi:methylmalonyl-CoA/ethylmalonyl-CoA epimerase